MSTKTAPPAAGTIAARQRRKEARPQELLDAALELFVAKGFAATRTEEVAARAGVSKGTLYLYFQSKEELLKEVVRHYMVNQIAEGRDIVARFEGRTSDLLALILGLWWERIGDTPASGIIKVMISEVRNFPEIAQFYFDEVITPSTDMLGELLRRGIGRGEFRAVNVPDVVHALVGPMVFLVLNKHSIGACSIGPPPEPRAVIRALTDMVLHGLEQPPRPAPRATRADRTVRA